MNISDFEDLIIKYDNILSIEWVTGGITGGSCYDDNGSNYSSVSSEIEPDFQVLENILSRFDDLKYSTYKKIKNIILIKDNSESGYYGNSTEKRIKYIYLSDLKQVLIEDNCFSDDDSNVFKF